jgi:hypothetical protein
MYFFRKNLKFASDKIKNDVVAVTIAAMDSQLSAIMDMGDSLKDNPRFIFGLMEALAVDRKRLAITVIEHASARLRADSQFIERIIRGGTTFGVDQNYSGYEIWKIADNLGKIRLKHPNYWDWCMELLQESVKKIIEEKANANATSFGEFGSLKNENKE